MAGQPWERIDAGFSDGDWRLQRGAACGDRTCTADGCVATGVDLSEAEGNGPAVAARYAAKVRRLLERERIRGVRRHWSYDLNRHIALKEVLDDLLRAANPQTSEG